MRRPSKSLGLVSALGALLLLSNSCFSAGNAASSSTSSQEGWAFDAPQYPIAISSGTSCVSSAGYLYCIGGSTPVSGGSNPTAAVYFAKENPAPLPGSTAPSTSGVGPLNPWALSPNPYPVPVSQQSCVTSGGYVYCVGGCLTASAPNAACPLTDGVEFAQLTSSGVGKWATTTPYPFAVEDSNCIASSGYIYCVGDISDIAGRGVDAATYFAPITPTGVGQWKASPGGVYSTFGSCVTASTYVYCIGGTTGFDAGHADASFAPISSSGFGAWTKTTPYPYAILRQSCAVDGSTVYCVGGVSGATSYVYSATLSSTGIGPWSPIPNGPVSVHGHEGCVVDSGYLYCANVSQDTQPQKTNAVAYYPLKTHAPIIFLPGVAGTQLLSAGKEVWPYVSGVANALAGAAPDSVFQPLQLDSTGSQPVNPASKITVGYVLCPYPEPSTCFSKTNFYGSLMANLTAQGYTLGKDLYFFGYDWRVDNQAHLAELNTLIGTAIKTSGINSTILIAHSMGGVISRGYLLYCAQKPQDSSCSNAKHVSTLITIGTPDYGATKVYYGMLMGYNFGNPKASVNVMKALLLNFPAAYELLPKSPFVFPAPGCKACPSGSPTAPLPLDWTYSIVSKGLTVNSSGYFPTSSNTWTMNQALLNLAETFFSPAGDRSSPNPLPSYVKYYAVIGYGVSTLISYTARDATPQDKSYLQTSDGQHVVLEPVFGDGDGTVPMWSLSATGSTATKYFIPYVHHYFSSDQSSKHSDLPANPVVQGIVKSIINGKPVDASHFTYPGRPTDLQPNPETTGAVFGSIDFVLHSNAQMTVTDGKGGLAGVNSTTGVIDESIGTGTYIAMDSVEYASMQNITQPYTVKVMGTSTGEFSLTVDIHSPTASRSFTYPQVPVAAGASTQMAFTGSSLLAAGNSPPPPLVVSSSGGVSSTVQAASLTATTTSGQSSNLAQTQAGAAGGASGQPGLNFSSIPQLLPDQVTSPLAPYLRPVTQATGLRPDIVIIGALVLLLILAGIGRAARRKPKK